MASSDLKHAAKKTSPAPLKLRNSCEACANSKVKCSQDKPRCTRCTKKQLNCDYVMARRGGRKPNSVVRAMAEGVSDHSAHGRGSSYCAGQYEGHSYAKSSSGTSTSSNSPGPGSAQVWTSSAGADSSLFTPGYSMPCLDPAFSSTFTDTENDLQELMGLLPAKGTTVHASIWEGLEESHLPSAATKDMTPMLESNTALDVSALLDLLCGTDVNTTDTRSCSSHMVPVAHMWNRDEANCISPCNCLNRSTLLMQKLSSDPLCKRLSGEASVSVDQIRAIIDGNEDIADALGVVLECSCDKDGYLLSILSLMIFKILDRSAVLARKRSCSEGREMIHCGADQRQPPWPPSSRQSSTSSSLLESYCLEGRDFPRMINQLVLSKLHRVGRLADQLSKHLQIAASRTHGFVGAGFREEQDVAASLMCTQLGLDVRKRLNALSRELVQRLRSL